MTFQKPTIAMATPRMDMNIKRSQRALLDKVFEVINYMKMIPFAAPYVDTAENIKEIILFVEKQLINFGVITIISDEDREAVLTSVQARLS